MLHMLHNQTAVAEVLIEANMSATSRAVASRSTLSAVTGPGILVTLNDSRLANQTRSLKHVLSTNTRLFSNAYLLMFLYPRSPTFPA